MFSDSEFHGKTVVITGGGGSIGAAIAEAFASKSANVILVGKTATSLDRVCDRLAESYPTQIIQSYVCDVTKRESIPTIIEFLNAQKLSIDVAVLSAGTQLRIPALQIKPDELNDILNVNFVGAANCAIEFGRLMRERGNPGRVVFITSLTAEIGIRNISAYGAAKGAVQAFSKALAVEWAGDGITVNCVGPGRIVTAMTDSIVSNDRDFKDVAKVIPMGRWGRPDDVTGAVLFFSSSLSSYITGQSLYVDGGWLAGCGNIRG